MNYPQPDPIYCPQCGKMLLKPTDIGEFNVKCPDCQKNWLVKIEVGWRYWQEYKKEKEK